MRDSIDTIIDSIGKAMQKRKGDVFTNLLRSN